MYPIQKDFLIISKALHSHFCLHFVWLSSEKKTQFDEESTLCYQEEHLNELFSKDNTSLYGAIACCTSLTLCSNSRSKIQ